MVVRKLFTASLKQVNVRACYLPIALFKVHTSLFFIVVFSKMLWQFSCTVVAVPLFRKFFYSTLTDETGVRFGDYDTNAYARAHVVMNIFGVKVNILYFFSGLRRLVPNEFHYHENKPHIQVQNLRVLGKGKVTLFNVGSSFSYETGINGSRRCALYPPASVSAPFYGYSKLWLHGSEESRNRRWSRWRSSRRPLAPNFAHWPTEPRQLLSFSRSRLVSFDSFKV